MKKSLLVILLAVFVFIASGTFAMDFMVGAKAGYFAWLPMYADMGTEGTLADVDWGTGVLYGPIISLIFTPELSLSISGLMGTQSTYWSSRFSPMPSQSVNVTGNYNFNVFRADFDSVLIYRLGTNFRIFAGYKYLLMSTSMAYTEIRTNMSDNSISEIDISELELSHYGHGPAIGFGYSHPISNTFFVTLTVSGVYMWGEWSVESTESYQAHSSGSYIVSPSSTMPDISKPMRHMGVNIEPAIGMSPGEGMPIVTLGVRYQHFRIMIEDAGEAIPEKWLDDKMIGVFVSVIFSF